MTTKIALIYVLIASHCASLLLLAGAFFAETHTTVHLRSACDVSNRAGLKTGYYGVEP